MKYINNNKIFASLFSFFLINIFSIFVSAHQIKKFEFKMCAENKKCIKVNSSNVTLSQNGDIMVLKNFKAYISIELETTELNGISGYIDLASQQMVYNLNHQKQRVINLLNLTEMNY